MSFWNIPDAKEIYHFPRNEDGHLNGTTFDKIKYFSDELTAMRQDRERVVSCNFNESSLSKTVISNIQFSDCMFNSCHFVNTVFENCKFQGCRFSDCNFHEVRFIDCHIDPDSIDDSIYFDGYENIATHTFQEIMNNSKSQDQNVFEMKSRVKFLYWQRQQFKAELKKLKIESYDPEFDIAKMRRKNNAIYGNKFYEITSQYGTNFGRFALTILIFCMLLSIFAFFAQNFLGLDCEGTLSFLDCFYFILISVTTLGYGDISPESWAGRIFSTILPVFGLIMFAFLTSMFTKRYSP